MDNRELYCAYDTLGFASSASPFANNTLGLPEGKKKVPKYRSGSITIEKPVNRKLPGLRRLKRLANLKPVIVIDTREQIPLPFTLPVVRQALCSGDYSIAGLTSLFSGRA